MSAKLQPPTPTRERAAPDRYEEVVRLLRRADTYPHHPASVDVLETHISCVFLAGNFVYKLKKPVRYEFVDFSTLAAREHACREELRLNRRLAADVYLDVVPITEDRGGTLWLAGDGAVVDWVVKMRRLPIENTLDTLVRSGRLDPSHVEQLARRLAEFYAGLSPLVVRPPDYRAAIHTHVRANRQELLDPVHGLPEPIVSRAHAAQLQFLAVAAPLLDSRVCDGRIVDGHGDLRPEHVCFEQRPAIFDCLEFNAELRRLDVADELCFLAMECDRLGASHVGTRVIDVYAARCGDRLPAALVNFYKSYRACVRAKVAVLRGRQVEGPARAAALDEAREYLQLADDYRTAFYRPLVIVVSGLMGSGKSTLAQALAEAFACPRLSTDLARREMFGESKQPAGYDEGTYRPERRERVYDELLTRADRLLAEGLPVALDGTFLSVAQLERAGLLAERHGARLLVVRCQCPDDVARKRIADRAAAGDDPSEARPELYELQKTQLEPCPRRLACMEVDTTDALVSQLDSVTGALRCLLPTNAR